MGRAEAFAPVFQISWVFAGAFAQITVDKRRGDAPKGVVESGEQHFGYGKQTIQAAYFKLGSLKMYKRLVNQSEFAVHSSVVARE